MNVLSKRWLLGAATLAIVAAAAVIGEPGDRRLEGRHGLGEGARADQRPAAARSPDRGERDPGRPEQGVGAPAAVQGQGRTARRSGTSCSTPPTQGIAHDLGVNYAPKLGNLAHRLPGVRADGDARLADARPEQVRPGGRQLPGRARLQPDPDRRAGPERLPAREVPAGRRRRAGLQPVHPDRRLADRLQRADRRDRRRPVRRRPPHEHRRPRARRPHRRAVGARASSPSRGSTCCS